MSTPGLRLKADDSSFEFLAKYEPLFFQLGFYAERQFALDPNAPLRKLRQFGEAMARSIAARLTVPSMTRTTQSVLLYGIKGLKA